MGKAQGLCITQTRISVIGMNFAGDNTITVRPICGPDQARFENTTHWACYVQWVKSKHPMGATLPDPP